MYRMYKLVMLLIVGGAALAYHGYKEFRLGQDVRAQATRMTCAQLAERGPGDNAHIVLTDYYLCRRAFIGRRANAQSPWTMIWIPVVAADSNYAQSRRFAGAGDSLPSDIRVVVKSANVHNDNELDNLATGAIEGIVVNNIESLGSKEKEVLAKSYPTIDFDKCWMLEEGRTVGSAPAAMGFMGIGGVLVVAGLVVVGKH